MENLWDVESLYEFQYFNCPICVYKHVSKQDFVYHTYNSHPESIEYFKKINDGSLNDILSPWEYTVSKNLQKSEIQRGLRSSDRPESLKSGFCDHKSIRQMG